MNPLQTGLEFPGNQDLPFNQAIHFLGNHNLPTPGLGLEAVGQVYRGSYDSVFGPVFGADIFPTNHLPNMKANSHAQRRQLPADPRKVDS